MTSVFIPADFRNRPIIKVGNKTLRIDSVEASKENPKIGALIKVARNEEWKHRHQASGKK